MKKSLSLFLALILALSLCVSPALAAGDPLDNFKKTAEYTDNFTDIPAGHWATSVIRTCYEYGLMNGTSATTFDPTGDLTIAQALVMACRIHEIYVTGASSLTNGSPWYQPYVDYAVSVGIVGAEDFADYNAKATRAEMAFIFYNAMPGVSLPAVNYVDFIPDVDENTPYVHEIFALYEAGILTGSDAYGTFRPDSTITRAEAAAIIARMAIYDQRKLGHTLLEDWHLGDNINFALPQGATISENTDNRALLETADSSCSALFDWVYDPNYAELSIDLFSAQEWQDLVVPSYDEGGIYLSNTHTQLIHYGSVPAYRTTSAFTDGVDVGHIVIIGFISDSELVICQYIVIGDRTDALYNLANQFRLHGNYADSKL